MSPTEIYWAEASRIVMKNLSESKDKHKMWPKWDKWAVWVKFMEQLPVYFQRENWRFVRRFFTLSYVEESPFYWVNTDKGLHVISSFEIYDVGVTQLAVP